MQRRSVTLLLTGVAGLAASITLVFLGMRAVMAIGGACASGGPFVPVQPCPDGVPILMTLGMLGIFGFGALALAAGSQIGGRFGAIPLLAWPALFLSLGWNFLEFGLSPPGDTGIAWSWLLCAIVFFAIGGGPLLIGLGLARETPAARIPERFGMPSARPVIRQDDVVDRLERLAVLRRRGDITTAEFEAAKRRLLGEEPA